METGISRLKTAEKQQETDAEGLLEAARQQEADAEGQSDLARIQIAFSCKAADPRSYSPLALAYIGDAVYDLMIRSVVVERGNRAANLLHRSTVTYVNAGAQAKIIQALLPLLTPQEEAIYRRGRNAKSHTAAKNATIEEYRKATGMEALLGYLYLADQFDRALELVRLGLEEAGFVI